MAAERKDARESFEQLKHDGHFHHLLRYLHTKYHTTYEPVQDGTTYCIRYIGLMDEKYERLFVRDGGRARYMVAYRTPRQPGAHSGHARPPERGVPRHGNGVVRLGWPHPADVLSQHEFPATDCKRTWGDWRTPCVISFIEPYPPPGRDLLRGGSGVQQGCAARRRRHGGGAEAGGQPGACGRARACAGGGGLLQGRDLGPCQAEGEGGRAGAAPGDVVVPRARRGAGAGPEEARRGERVRGGGGGGGVGRWGSGADQVRGDGADGEGFWTQGTFDIADPLSISGRWRGW